MNFRELMRAAGAVTHEYAAEMATLVGGFNCRITAEERNDWHRYALELTEYQNLQSITADMEVVLAQLHAQQDTQKANELHTKYLALRDEAADMAYNLFDAGRGWYDGILEARAARLAELEEESDG